MIIDFTDKFKENEMDTLVAFGKENTNTIFHIYYSPTLENNQEYPLKLVEMELLQNIKTDTEISNLDNKIIKEKPISFKELINIVKEKGEKQLTVDSADMEYFVNEHMTMLLGEKLDNYPKPIEELTKSDKIEIVENVQNVLPDIFVKDLFEQFKDNINDNFEPTLYDQLQDFFIGFDTDFYELDNLQKTINNLEEPDEVVKKAKIKR
jgi:hypothetical protein